MLLLDLLGVLFVGLGFFLVSHIVEVLRPVICSARKRVRSKPPRRRRRRQIETDLDGLLLLYRSGALDEQEYVDQADDLIDQLADVLNADQAHFGG